MKKFPAISLGSSQIISPNIFVMIAISRPAYPWHHTTTENSNTCWSEPTWKPLSQDFVTNRWLVTVVTYSVEHHLYQGVVCEALAVFDLVTLVAYIGVSLERLFMFNFLDLFQALYREEISMKDHSAHKSFAQMFLSVLESKEIRPLVSDWKLWMHHIWVKNKRAAMFSTICCHCY